MGRPPIPPEQRKKGHITVRLSELERAQLDELVDELGDGAGEILRRALAELHERILGKRRARPG